MPAPTAFALHQNVPNPFNPVTSIRYDVPAGGGRVHLAIYDVSGRRVAVLVDRHEQAGKHEVLWKGLDSAGRRAASGVYFCRLEAPGYRRTVKLVVLR
jgi:flagellar hook assembly protein FlgD